MIITIFLIQKQNPPSSGDSEPSPEKYVPPHRKNEDMAKLIKENEDLRAKLKATQEKNKKLLSIITMDPETKEKALLIHEIENLRKVS